MIEGEFGVYMPVTVWISEATGRKRYLLWRSHGKLRKKNTLEYLKTFDKRVYVLGLKAIEKQLQGKSGKGRV